MPDQKDRKISLPKGGMMGDVVMRIKLILRLMADRRVSIFIKALPVMTLLYLVFPDLVPTPIDDVAVIWLGTSLFVELCPPEVVQEHLNALRQVVSGEWRDVTEGEFYNRGDQKEADETQKIIDAESWDKPDH